MNRDEFVQFREQVIAAQDPLLLDGMNPFTVMAFLKQQFQNAITHTEDEALDLWARHAQMQDHRDDAIATKGVRAALSGVFNLCAAEGRELWLPEDVYPFYWQAASDEPLQPRAFKTMPAPDLSFLDDTADDALVLISNPVTPLGKHLDKAQTGKLIDWLGASENRRLVLDTVYTYDTQFDDSTLKLYETGRCIITHSLSKAWLERGVFGITLAPFSEREKLRRRLERPDTQASTSAYNAMTRQPDLPRIQEQSFKNEWQKLTPLIRQFDPNFKPPESGYLALTRARYDEVLANHNTLIIPATVFGSTQDDFSVVSCLETLKPT